MKDEFEIAGGTVLGKEHLRLGKNNQDAFVWHQSGDLLIAVVADGCGSGKFSEVGAQLGARLLTDYLAKSAKYCRTFDQALELARCALLDDLKKIAERMGGDIAETINKYFLFTLVGVMIIPEGAIRFHIGDGVLGANEIISKIGPFPNNQPPYLAYNLLNQSLTGFSLEELKFNAHYLMPTSDVRSIIIGTDGVTDLMRVFPLNQFWENDLYFKNPDAVRRRLALINRQSMKIDWEKQEVEKEEGRLPDDTTLIVIRRR